MIADSFRANTLLVGIQQALSCIDLKNVCSTQKTRCFFAFLPEVLNRKRRVFDSLFGDKATKFLLFSIHFFLRLTKNQGAE